MKNTQDITRIEVRSSINDNVVVSFERTEQDAKNVITAGYDKICRMLKINRVEAERRYYVTNN